MGYVLAENIFVDHLTGLQNFFKFIESDVNAVFGKQGSAIVFDFVGFQRINEAYGRDVGDVCLKNLADIIRTSVQGYENSNVFRTDGDEFTVVLPDITYLNTEKLADFIREEYRRTISDMGFADFDVRFLLLEYHKSLTSINEFYKMIFEHSFDNLTDPYGRLEGDIWTGTIITSFTRRIRETLALFSDAYNLALTDDVSGLPNSRAAKLYLSKLVREGNQHIKEFSIMFIDGDNLKRYNTINYEAGNEMIEKLSSILKTSVRKEDRVFRWLSGDEFLVVLDDTNYENTLKLAERIRVLVEETTREWVYPVTISIGVSNYPKDGSSIEEIIDKAEKANSRAKNSGKNRVVQWEEIDKAE